MPIEACIFCLGLSGAFGAAGAVTRWLTTNKERAYLAASLRVPTAASCNQVARVASRLALINSH